MEDLSGFDDFKKRVGELFKEDFMIKYKDSDGDLINIAGDEELQTATKSGSLTVRLESYGFLTKEEQFIYDGIQDGIVISDKKGVIQYANAAMTKIFGYSNSELLNENVKILTPKAINKKHSKYIKNYLKTGVPKIIGKGGREVFGKTKEKYLIPIYLTISEKRVRDKITFIARIQKMDEQSKQVVALQDPLLKYALYEGILDAAIIIDDMGVIQYVNNVAEKLFGYSKNDLRGKNVKVLMPEPFKSEHDSYLGNYRSSHIPKVMGSSRDVPIQKKDGTIQEKNLKLTTVPGQNGETLFVGCLTDPIHKVAKSQLELEREVLNTLLIPAIIIDTVGSIQAFNEACCNLFGYQVSEVIGKNIKMLMTKEDSDNHDAHLKNYAQTGKGKIIGKGREVFVLKKDGTTAKKDFVCYQKSRWKQCVLFRTL